MRASGQEAIHRRDMRGFLGYHCFVSPGTGETEGSMVVIIGGPSVRKGLYALGILSLDAK